MVNSEQNKYRHIFKATSLLGGVQVFSILLNLIRSKFIAVLLGPAGMGISGIFVSVTNLISSAACFGVNYSGVREVSLAYQSNDIILVRKVSSTVRRLITVGGLLGAIVMWIFAENLSYWSFNNQNFKSAFQLLSAVVFTTCIFNGNVAILQGVQKLKASALLSLTTTFLGILLSIPIYWIWKLEGIAYALIISSLAAAIASEFFFRSQKLKDVSMPFNELISEGKEMVKLGGVMMISVFIGSLTTFLINSFIARFGNVADVGLYQAGSAITNQYVAMVFTSMSIDYFPRLSAVCQDKEKTNELVNQQGEVILLIVAPLLCCLIIAAPLVVKILLSHQFSPVVKFVKWVALGMFFKAASYPIGYISFAKGDKKSFFFLEGIGSNVLTLVCCILGYHIYGLDGLGIAFAVNYGLYLTIIITFTFFKYLFSPSRSVKRVFLIQSLFVVAVFLLSINDNNYYYLGFAILISLYEIFFSIKTLNNRVNIRSMFSKKSNEAI